MKIEMEQIVAIIMVSVPCAAIGGFIVILGIKALLSRQQRRRRRSERMQRHFCRYLQPAVRQTYRSGIRSKNEARRCPMALSM